MDLLAPADMQGNHRSVQRSMTSTMTYKMKDKSIYIAEAERSQVRGKAPQQCLGAARQLGRAEIGGTQGLCEREEMKHFLKLRLHNFARIADTLDKISSSIV